MKSLESFIQGSFFQRIILTGCGSTHYLALAAGKMLALLTDTPVQVHPSSEVWLWPDLFPVEDTLLVAVSRSGTTTETLRAVERFRAEGGGNVMVITCYPHSPLAKQADMLLVAPEAQEKSVVQTRSFTSMALLAFGFAFVLGKRHDLVDEMDRLPEKLERLVREYAHWTEAWADPHKFQRIFFLGNGPHYGLACEAMLKVKEMSLSWVEAYHTLEFRHGPMSLVDDHSLVVALLSDTARQQELDVLEDLQHLGASIVVCGASQGAGLNWSPEFYMDTSDQVYEWLRGILVLPLLQRLGYQRALRVDQNPDLPRNLSQVIEI